MVPPGRFIHESNTAEHEGNVKRVRIGSTDQRTSDTVNLMSPRSLGLTDAVQTYVAAHTSSPDAVQTDLIERTEQLGGAAVMQIAPEQGELLTTLCALTDATFAVEVGTFTGYSSIAIARGLAPGGRLLCCDVSEEWTSIAAAYWERAGVADRIELQVAPAIETLRALDADLAVDFAFIDADKGGYVDYYEELVARLTPTGLICVDNTLWSGAVADPTNDDDDTLALRRFNSHVAADPRTRQVIVPIGDGLTLIRRA
jgi:caffeoyl-CoA O-methyltransferase